MTYSIQVLNEWSRPRAKYFGVIAGLVIFGSWTVSNVLGTRVNEAQARVSTVASAQGSADWQRRVELKLGNLEKLILRSRTTELPGDVAKLDVSHQRLYQWSRQIEFLTSFLDDWTRLDSSSNYAALLCLGTSPPRRITTEIGSIHTRVEYLYSQFVAARSDMDRASNEVLDAGKSYQQITSYQADRLAEAMKKYRDAVQGTPIQSDYIVLENRLLRAEGELTTWASRSLTFWKTVSSTFQYVALALYAAGTLLAIYGKWLEVVEQPSASGA